MCLVASDVDAVNFARQKPTRILMSVVGLEHLELRVSSLPDR